MYYDVELGTVSKQRNSQAKKLETTTKRTYLKNSTNNSKSILFLQKAQYLIDFALKLVLTEVFLQA